MADLRRYAFGLGLVVVALTLWATQQYAQSGTSSLFRVPVQRFATGQLDSALVWGPNTYTSSSATTWTYTAATLTIPSYDAAKRYFVRITNGDTASGANRVSQASLTIGGKEFLSSSDITTSIASMNKVVQINQAQSTIQVGVLGPVGRFIKARIYETSDQSYDLHTTTGEITVPNGLNLISDSFSKPANASGPWTVRVANGDGSGGNTCTNLKVTLNGVDVIPLGLVNASNLTALRQVTLQTNNAITLRLYGASGQATLYWAATDTSAPVLTVIRPTEAYVTDSATVATSGTVSDQVAPITVTVGGVAGTTSSYSGFTVAKPLPVDGLYTFTVKARDRAGFEGTVTRHVIRDQLPPVMNVEYPPLTPPTVTLDSVLVVGSWSDTSITTVTVDDIALGTDSSGVFSRKVALDMGSNGLLFRARDAMGHEVSFKRYVNRASADINVIGAAMDQPAFTGVEPTAFRNNIAFLFSGGGSPVQTGATAESIKATRAAVIRGRVLSRDLGPLPKVVVRVLGHPEYGQTETREDGRYDLAVSGGQQLTLRFVKADYLEAQRQVSPRPLDYTQVNDVALMGESTRLLNVTSTPAMVTGRFESDLNGDRRMWLYLPGGVTAAITPDGGATQAPLSGFNIKLREFTVGGNGDEAMPGQLPPSTAYTYCVDMSLQEADNIWKAQPVGTLRPKVTFSAPLSSYVKDFMGTPVGTTVPSGYYDPRTAKWVANEDGRVVRIFSITAGLATLDSNNDGLADSQSTYDSLHVDIPERTKLGATFHVGDVLWRMRIDHFSGHDFNYNVGSSPGSSAPLTEVALSGAALVGDPSNTCGCVIENENRVLGESIPITGTPFALHYRSSRQQDDLALRIIRIPITGTSVPNDLLKVHVIVDIAGRRFTKDYLKSDNTLTTNLTWSFEDWDGSDVYGRAVLGSVPATVRVGYEWPQRYALGRLTGGSFNNGSRTAGAPSMSVSGDRGAGRIEWRTQVVSLGAPSLGAAGLGHWTISPHHVYDPTGNGTLYRGDGTTRFGRARFPVIKKYAGSGASSADVPNLSPPDSIVKTAAATAISAVRLAIAADGTIYYADGLAAAGGDVVRRVTPDMRVEPVAGGGSVALADGVAATSVNLSASAGVDGVAVEVSGTPLIVARALDRVFRVTAAGTVQIVAGSSQDSTSRVEGALATAFRLFEPSAVAVGPDGSIFIGDVGAFKIYKVATDGTIRTFAGTGQDNLLGNPSEGGPAISGGVGRPESIGVDADGKVYFVSSTGPALFEIEPDGFMRRLLPIPDHGLTSLAVGPDGALFLGQTGSFSGVMRREPSGELSILAGTILNSGSPLANFATSEGEAAAAAQLANLQSIAVDANGDIFTAEATLVSGGTILHGPAGIRRISQESPLVVASELYYPSEDGREASVFSLAGRHLRTFDTRTGKTLYSFGYTGDQLTSITDASGNVTTIDRSAGVPTAIIAPLAMGHVRTALGVNAQGYLETVSHPDGGIDSLWYQRASGNSTPGSAASLLVRHRSPEGGPHTFDYDEKGRLFKDTDPAGGYNVLALLATSITDSTRTITRTTRMGRVTQYDVKELLGGIHRRLIRSPDLTTTFHSDGNNLGNNLTVSTAVPPYGEVLQDVGSAGEVTLTRITRDKTYGTFASVGSPITTRLPSGLKRSIEVVRDSIDLSSSSVLRSSLKINGDKFTSAYNKTTRVLTLSSSLSRTATIDLDLVGRPTTVSVGGLAAVSLVYDAGSGFLRDLTQGPRNWHYDYDDSGRVSTARDPALREVTYRYDAAGRVLRQTLPGARTVGYSYDLEGRMTSLTPPGRPAHRFHYTPNGLNDRYVPPAVAGATDSTQYTYNFDGQLETVTRPGGELIQLGYDGTKGRLDTITEPRGVHVFDYWDATQGGLLKTVFSPDSIFCDYSYDGPLLTQETWRGRVLGSVTHGYDNAFRPATESVNGGSTVSYGYDADGLLNSLAGAWGTMTLTPDPVSGLLSGTSIGTVASTLGYNVHGELTDLDYTVGSVPYYHEHLVRDALGRITHIDETIAGTSTSRTYGYDAAGRLASVTEADNPAASRGWEYDAGQPGNGNRTLATYGPGVAPDSAYYDEQDRLLRYGNDTFGAAYDWTAAGELSQRVRPNQRLTTTYDALGNLTVATLKPLVNGSEQPGGSTTTTVAYRIDGQNRRVERMMNSPSGVTTQRWLYRDGLAPAAELDATSAVVNRYVYGTQDHAPDLVVRTDGTYRVITDHLGSIRALVNIATGAVAQRIDYDAWGNETQNTAPALQSLGYAGGLTDAETKLVRFGARDYDPGVGRWTAKDPAGASGGANFYAYTHSSPVSQVDPTGLRSCGNGSDPDLVADDGFDVSKFVVGFGDASGIPQWIRQIEGLDDTPFVTSPSYQTGQLVGAVWGWIPVGLEGVAWLGGLKYFRWLNTGNRLVGIGPGKLGGKIAPRISLYPRGNGAPHIDLRTRLPLIPPYGAIVRGLHKDAGGGCDCP